MAEEARREAREMKRQRKEKEDEVRKLLEVTRSKDTQLR